MDKAILAEIDRTIKEIWEVDIKNDYNEYFLLKEDRLKCALYYHMRKRLEGLLKKMVFANIQNIIITRVD